MKNELIVEEIESLVDEISQGKENFNLIFFSIGSDSNITSERSMREKWRI